VCIDKDSKFYLRKLRRDTVVLIPVEVQEKHRSHARSAQAVGSLRTYQLREGLKDYCCRECTESKNQIPEVFERFSQGVRAGVLMRLKFASKSSGGSAPLKVLKGRWRLKTSHRS
jgi:hypothetical protein